MFKYMISIFIIIFCIFFAQQSCILVVVSENLSSDKKFDNIEREREVKESFSQIEKVSDLCIISKLKLKINENHNSIINKISYSPDGMNLATASDDGSVKIWDTIDGRLLKSININKGQVFSVIYSPNGKMIATADGELKIWNTKNGSLIRKFEEESKSIHSISYSPDGSNIASGANNGTIKIWNTKNGSLIRKFEVGNNLRELVYSPNGKMIATADGELKIWSSTSGFKMYHFSNENKNITKVDFSPNGKYVAGGNWQGGIGIWNIATKSNIHIKQNRGSTYTSVVFSPNGAVIAVAGPLFHIKLYSTKDGSIINTLITESINSFLVAFSPKGQYMASTHGDGIIRLWTCP